MTTKSLGNPFDGDKSLIHAKTCGCPECKPGDSTPSISLDLKPSAGQQAVADEHLDSEAMMDRAIEGAVVRSVSFLIYLVEEDWDGERDGGESAACELCAVPVAQAVRVYTCGACLRESSR